MNTPDEHELRFGMLGPVEALMGRVPLDLGPRQRRLLLVRLLIEDGRPVSGDTLLSDLWMHEEHGVPLSGPKAWPAYPTSYGSGGQRLTAARWSDSKGVCGHMHVPENVHGDPGAIDFARVVKYAKAELDVDDDTTTDSAPAKPKVPAFPGRKFFAAGASNAYVLQLGKELVKRGFGDHYKVGPSRSWGEADRLNVRDFQKSRKELRGDADGAPGPLTWRLLFSGAA